jgi:hypothetical protein
VTSAIRLTRRERGLAKEEEAKEEEAKEEEAKEEEAKEEQGSRRR